MDLPEIGAIEAFAMIVDVNGFSQFFSKSRQNDGVAQFVRDILIGGIEITKKHGGLVVNLMGDAFLALLDDAHSVYMTCIGIAKDLDRQCEYISDHQENYPDDWHYARGGAGLKIAVEYGWIDISNLNGDLLGHQKLFIGPPINYASRISTAGIGNRCLVGPKGMNIRGLNQWRNYGPFTMHGKPGEGDYIYWQLDLGDIWREGNMGPDDDTFWG